VNDLSNVFRIRPSSKRSEFPAKMAYKTVYNNDKGFVEDRITTGERRPYKGELVDFNLDNKWIDDLYKIPNITLRHFSQGKSHQALTFVIFRPDDQSPIFLNKIVKKLTKNNTKVDLFIGNGAKHLVCVATKNWYRPIGSNVNWKKWWESIANRIDSAVNK
jgi:hypothetical protein